MILSAVLVLIVAVCFLYLAQLCVQLVVVAMGNDSIFSATFFAGLGLVIVLGVADFAYKEYRALTPEPMAVEETVANEQE